MGKSREYAYARVSSTDQNLARQIEAFKELGVPETNIITEKKSGKNTDDRVAYRYLKEVLLREGDTLIIKDLDRLSRKKVDIKDELEYYKENNIRVKIMSIPTTMIDLPEKQSWITEMVNNILVEVLSSMAEQERLTTRRRQREGIDIALRNGTKFGRPKITVDDELFKTMCVEWEKGERTAKEVMNFFGMSKSTFYRKVNERKNEI